MAQFSLSDPSKCSHVCVNSLELLHFPNSLSYWKAGSESSIAIPQLRDYPQYGIHDPSIALGFHLLHPLLWEWVDVSRSGLELQEGAVG